MRSPKKGTGREDAGRYYTSDENLRRQALQASKGTSGFDIVVPTRPSIPQMIQNGLLEKFDKSKLPNMVNVDPLYLAQAWSPPDYSVCKDWGSTGWFYDKTKIKTEVKHGPTSSRCARARAARTATCSIRPSTWAACTSGRMTNGTPRAGRPRQRPRSSPRT